MIEYSATNELSDDFPDTHARRAVVAIVRGFGEVQRKMNPHFAQFDLTPSQFQMLTVINRLQNPQISQRRLGPELYVSPANISVMLRRLEDKGLICRTANSDDGREKFVQLTRQGKSLLRRVWKTHQSQLEHVMIGLDNDERLKLTHLLGKMIAAHTVSDAPANSPAPLNAI